MTTKVVSVSLSKQVRSEMLHSFFRDISRQPRIELEKVEHSLALDIYDLIYGGLELDLENVPKSMLRLEGSIPLPTVFVAKKKGKKTKGKIMPTIKETFCFQEFTSYIDIGYASPTADRGSILLPNPMPQAYSASRYHSNHLPDLLKLGLVSKVVLNKIEKRYVQGCKDGSVIFEPIVEAMAGVTEILRAVKTTKGLLAAWPGCEKYLKLPETTRGVLVKVDVKVLDKSLESLYPPAKKTA